MTNERFEKIRKMVRIRAIMGDCDWGQELVEAMDRLKAERDSLFIELGKYSDVPSFEYWKDRAEKAEAERGNRSPEGIPYCDNGIIKIAELEIELAASQARVKRLEEALKSLDAGLGDRLLAKGPLSKEYAHEIQRKISEALQENS